MIHNSSEYKLYKNFFHKKNQLRYWPSVYCWFSVDYNTDFFFPDVIVGTFDSVHYSSDRSLGAAYTIFL